MSGVRDHAEYMIVKREQSDDCRDTGAESTEKSAWNEATGKVNLKLELELERQRPFRQAELQENFGVIEWGDIRIQVR